MRVGAECVFLGRSTLDLLYQVPEFPREDTKTMATRFLARCGGPALNAAVTFAFLGGDAHLISAIGRGGASGMLKSELRHYGVRLTDICDHEEFSPPVSSVIINATSGSRTIFNAPALPCVQQPELENALSPAVTGDPAAPIPSAPLLLADGFYTSEALGFLRGFHARGGAICLDGGSWKPETETLLPLVSMAICSERFSPPGIRTIEEKLDYLAARGLTCAAMTRGASPILARDRGRTFSIPIEPVDAVDTLAAGDILHGAFCWYFLSGKNFEESLRAASRVSTLSVRFFGCREWMAHFGREGR
jgi:sugar/nucleoside kinase (ribokinase family)